MMIGSMIGAVVDVGPVGVSMGGLGVLVPMAMEGFGFFAWFWVWMAVEVMVIHMMVPVFVG